MADKIDYIKDKRGRRRFPITHEKAVRDSEWVRLEEKLNDLEAAIREIGGGCSCLAPMIVEGTAGSYDDAFTFVPNVGMPSFAEARAYMIDGGQVYMIIDTGEETILNVAVSTGSEHISGLDYNWPKPDSEGGDDSGDEPPVE